MLGDGDIVVHIADGRSSRCETREHGIVRPDVPAGNTFDGVERPYWIGVVWRDGDQRRHPDANLRPCTCALD